MLTHQDCLHCYETGSTKIRNLTVLVLNSSLCAKNNYQILFVTNDHKYSVDWWKVTSDRTMTYIYIYIYVCMYIYIYIFIYIYIYYIVANLLE